MSTHANRVKMTVTSVASAGTGTITLNAASTGFRSFATAYGANATVDILITEGTAWEIARNCTYTHSGTTVSRGTLENSSTGSAVVFTSAAAVSVIATAAFGNNAALNHVAGGDADTTMAVGNMYVTDMSGWATADRTYTLPAAAAVGDRIGIMVTAGDASHELIIKPNTGNTINGGSAAAEWSRLFITGEVVILRCVTADSAWVVEYDGRIPSQCRIYLSADTALTSTALVKVPLNTNDTTLDVGNLESVSNNGITVRRAGRYEISGQIALLALTDAKYLVGQFFVGGSAIRTYALLTTGVSAAQYVYGATKYYITAGQEVLLYGQQNDGTSETWQGGDDVGTCDLHVVEIL
ncbi:MAG: hypothetical protein IPG77_25350 [Betaproteobacteria bacterium]|nr:hypothetical protein [Betaproteobacteria bacterium]